MSGLAVLRNGAKTRPEEEDGLGCGGAARGWGGKQEMKKPMPEPLLGSQQGGLVPGRLTVCSLNWRLGPLEPSTLPALSTQALRYLSCELNRPKRRVTDRDENVRIHTFGPVKWSVMENRQ